MKKTYLLDSQETVLLNGYPMALRYRANDLSLPVLLFLHGGPGVCDRHWVLKYQSALADRCIMVCWDQRGAGKSYDPKYAKTQHLTLDMMVEDAHAVVEYLKRKFGREKVLIVGHSWGSLLGTLLAQKYPDDIAAYLGMGQFVYGAENEQLSYDFVVDEAQKRGDKKGQRELARIGAPVEGKYRSMDDMMTQRNYMTKYGGGCYREKESIWSSMIIPLLKTPEYSLFELPSYANGSFYCLRELWDAVVAQDLFKTMPELKVPVFMLEGRHDWNTPIAISCRWYEALKAPRKEWFWFEESAHSPIKEEPELWGERVAAIVSEFAK